MQILTFINFAAAVQGLFLGYLLINKKSDSREYRILALLVFSMSVALLGAVLGLSGYYRELPHLIRVGDPLVLLFGPLLYFYIFQLTQGRMPPMYTLHLLPFLAYLILLVPFYVLSGPEKIAFVEKVFFDSQNNIQVVLIQLMRAVHLLTYVILSLLLIRKFGRYLRDNYSDLDQLNLDKAALLLRFFVGITAFRIAVYLASIFVHLNFVVTNNIVGLMTAVVIYALAYSLWNRNVHVSFPSEPSGQGPVKTDAPSLETSSEERSRNTYYLSDEQCAVLAEKLEQLFIKEQVFLENELSLAQLSDRLGVPAYQTSELINRKYREPFFDFINRKRIEEVKRRLGDAAYDHYSILGIALDCGFNSKSSFNAAFKKFTGSTPSRFRQQ